MNKLKCDICGGQIEMQPDKRGLCLNCATSYSLATMKEMFSGVKVSVTGSNEDVEQWRLLLDRYYSAGDFAEAERITKKILEAAPSDKQANLIYDELQILKYFDVKNGVVKSYTGTARKITIPSIITEIEAKTFADNHYIEEVVLPDTVTVIEESLFENCINLKHVHLPTNLKTISDGAFRNCRVLEVMVIPARVSEIGHETFKGCTSLKGNVRLENVKYIGKGAFSGCHSISSIVISNCSGSIGCYAFSYCSQLTSFTIPSGITEISGSMFEGCSKLTNVKIPETVKSIIDRAFKDCISLHEIAIPASVTQLGSYIERDYGSQLENRGVFAGCTSLVKVNLNHGLETIGDFTFSGCHSLTSIEIPSSVRLIGYGAFKECKALCQISIPSSVLSIAAGYRSYSTIVHHPPFDCCVNLKYIEYPDRFADTIFTGSKFYAIREERKKNGLCPNCGGHLSFWSGRCYRCD